MFELIFKWEKPTMSSERRKEWTSNAKTFRIKRIPQQVEKSEGKYGK